MHQRMLGRVRTTSWLLPMLALAMMLGARPATAAITVTSLADESTNDPANGDTGITLREAIEWVNDGQSDTDPAFPVTEPIIVGRTGTINLTEGDLPELTRLASLILQAGNLTIAGAAGLRGPWYAINADAPFQLTFRDSSTPISVSGVGGDVVIVRVTVTGSSQNGVHVNGGNTVVLAGILINNSDSGDGVLVSGANQAILAGITARNVNGNGININNMTNIQLISLPPASFGTYPTNRMHNYIGFNSSYDLFASTQVSGDGLTIQESGRGTVTIQDLDVGRIGGTGILIDPDEAVRSDPREPVDISVRRVHVGVAPFTSGVGSSFNSIWPVSEDGLVIAGGRADVQIGSRSDVGFDHPDEGDLTNAADLGITTSGTFGTGIRIGSDDDPLDGDVLVQYARSGLDVTGNAEVIVLVNADDRGRRRQQYGLVARLDSGDRVFRVRNSQFTGNTRGGVDIQGTTRIAFDRNNVGLVADTTQPPGPSTVRADGQGDPVPTGNGTRTFNEGVVSELPDTVIGFGARIVVNGYINSFHGNVISGNAVNGLELGTFGGNPLGGTDALVNLTDASDPVPLRVDGTMGLTIADNSVTMNRIGVQGRGDEGGRYTYASADNANRGRKLFQNLSGTPFDDASGAGTMFNANGAAVNWPLNTPRIRGNGTILFTQAGEPGLAVGHGAIISNTGPLTIAGITVSDSALNGLLLNDQFIGTLNDPDNALVRLVGARIGTDDTGSGPGDQSLGNGTVLRAGDDWNQISGFSGAGIFVDNDGDHMLGSDALRLSAAQATGERPIVGPLLNIISGNLTYGIQASTRIGVDGAQAGASANTNIGIANSHIGVDVSGTSAGTIDVKRLGFGNGHSRTDDPVTQPVYPHFFGAGIRFEPSTDGSVGGRHLIGGLEDSLRNVISNNGLVGVWLRGEGSVSVANNVIGGDVTGTMALTNARQAYGVLVEQPEFSRHAAITGAPAGDAMQPQYIGRVPFLGLTNGPTGTPSTQYKGNVIIDNKVFGVALEDNADHQVAANRIGIGFTGTAVPNGTDMGNPNDFDFEQLIVALGNQPVLAGGVVIGAITDTVVGDLTIGGFDDQNGDGIFNEGTGETPRGNVISGNVGNGVAQYDDSSALILLNQIGVDATGDTAVPNTLDGVYIFGDVVNRVAYNTISGNAGSGVHIVGAGDNRLYGNVIGANHDGTVAVPNQRYGVFVGQGATGSNEIGRLTTQLVDSRTGDTLSTSSNLISGNDLSGVRLDGSGGNVVRASLIGLNVDGTTALPNGQADQAGDRDGVLIAGTGANRVGGATAAERNRIAGNLGHGVAILGDGDNVIEGNFIGLNAAGTNAVPNQLAGVAIEGADGGNQIRTNVITGNLTEGVRIAAAGGANELRANLIGTTPTGEAMPAGESNGSHGVYVTASTTAGQRIGVANSSDTALDRGNLISGNGGQGVLLSGPGDHVVLGNRIGTNRAGDAAIANAGAGVRTDIDGDATVSIGGTLTGQSNLVSGNADGGIVLTGSAEHQVRGNRVGLNAAGVAAVANEVVGILVDATSRTTLSENRVAGNNGAGVEIRQGQSVLTLNRIGTQVDGNGQVPNTGPGLWLRDDATPGTHQIGLANQGNIISGNADDGVRISGQGSYTLLSNTIGLNLNGDTAVPNQGAGLHLVDGDAAAMVVVGGTGSSQGNTISGNAGDGVLHEGAQPLTTFVNNTLGTNATGSGGLGNQGSGIVFASTALTDPVVLGGTGANQANVIAGNSGNGVELRAGTTHVVEVRGNLIGTNASGAVALANLGHGVVVASDQENVVAGNTLSGNGQGGTNGSHGVLITGAGNNRVLDNSIGGSAGGDALPNGVGNTGDGVRIDGSDDNLVEGNIVRDNGGRGIAVVTGTGNRLTRNAIIANDVLAIDLGVGGVLDGVTPNDGTTDPNAGNLGLDFPVLRRLVNSAGAITLSGLVPAGATRIEIYRAADANVPDDTFDPLEHHGGAADKEPLAVVTVAPGATTFDATLSGLGADELVTALAVDAAGNTSEFSRNLGFVSPTNSVITATPTTVKADGVSEIIITLEPRDSIGTPIIGLTDVALLYDPDLGVNQSPANPLADTDNDGLLTAVLTSTTPGTTTVTAQAGGMTITNGVDITFQTPDIDIAQSSFTADKTDVTSDGTDTVTFTFTIRDVNGDPRAGLTPSELGLFVTVAPTNAGITINQPTQPTDANGQTTATATSTVNGTFTFTGHFGGASGEVVPSPVEVTFSDVPVDAAASKLTVTPTSVAADDSTTAQLTLTILGEDGNPVADVPADQITFTAVRQGTNTPADVTITELDTKSSAQGIFRATIRSGAVGVVTVRATVRGTTIDATAAVTFQAGPPSDTNSTIDADPDTGIADGVTPVSIIVTVRDADDRPKPNTRVELRVTPPDGAPANSYTVSPAGTTDANGVFTGTLTAGEVGTYQVQAIVGQDDQRTTIGPRAVFFGEVPPNADNSSLAISDDELLAEAGSTATLTITLVDAQGNPVVGVTPSEIVVSSDPAGVVTVDAPTTPTDANGQTTAVVRGAAPGQTAITVVAQGVTLSQTVQVTVRDFVALEFGPGTHFIGVPVNLLDPMPAAVFGQLLPGLRLARWNPNTEEYVFFTDAQASSFLRLEPGKGFWLQLSDDFRLVAVGTPQPNEPVEVPTSQGWNQLANPYTQPLPFDAGRIQVLRNGGVVGTLDTAAAQALVDPYAWKWDPVDGYLLVLDPDVVAAADVPGVIGVGQGFWLNVRASGVEIRILPPTATGRATRTQAATPRAWMLGVEASVTGLPASQALLGAGPTRMAAVVPPDAPVGAPVRIRLLDETGRALAADVRHGPLTQRTRWTALVEAPEGAEVTLSWPSLNRGLPGRHNLYLVDETTGQRTLLNARAGYAYRQATPTRQFTLELDPQGRRTLAVTSMTVTPGRGRALPVTFTITAPADVVVQVKGLQGTIVRTLREQVGAGTQSLSWDRRDDNGRTVPAGIYTLELVATTQEGETVRVMRQVRVP